MTKAQKLYKEYSDRKDDEEKKSGSGSQQKASSSGSSSTMTRAQRLYADYTKRNPEGSTKGARDIQVKTGRSAGINTESRTKTEQKQNTAVATTGNGGNVAVPKTASTPSWAKGIQAQQQKATNSKASLIPAGKGEATQLARQMSATSGAVKNMNQADAREARKKREETDYVTGYITNHKASEKSIAVDEDSYQSNKAELDRQYNSGNITADEYDALYDYYYGLHSRLNGRSFEVKSKEYTLPINDENGYSAAKKHSDEVTAVDEAAKTYEDYTKNWLAKYQYQKSGEADTTKGKIISAIGKATKPDATTRFTQDAVERLNHQKAVENGTAGEGENLNKWQKKMADTRLDNFSYEDYGIYKDKAAGMTYEEAARRLGEIQKGGTMQQAANAEEARAIRDDLLGRDPQTIRYNNMTDEDRGMMQAYFDGNKSRVISSTAKGAANAAYSKLKMRGYTDDEIKQFSARQDLLSRRSEATEKAYAFAEKHPIAASITSVGTNLVTPLQFMQQMANQVENKLGNRYSDMHAGDAIATYTDQIRESVKQQIENKYGSVAAFGYGPVMSIADNVATMAVSVALMSAAGPLGTAGAGNSMTSVQQMIAQAEPLTLAIMGTQVAGRAYAETIEKGGTETQATAMAIISGAAEIAAEKMGIDTVLGDPTNLASYVLKTNTAEGMEELFSAVIGDASDFIVMGDKSDYYRMLNANVESGMSREAAAGHVVFEQATDAAKDFLGGFIAGGGFNIPVIAGQVVTGIENKTHLVGNVQTGRSVKGDSAMNSALPDVMADARTLSANAETEAEKKLAKESAKAEKKESRGRGMSDYGAGKLTRAVQDVLLERTDGTHFEGIIGSDGLAEKFTEIESAYDNGEITFEEFDEAADEWLELTKLNEDVVAARAKVESADMSTENTDMDGDYSRFAKGKADTLIDSKGKAIKLDKAKFSNSNQKTLYQGAAESGDSDMANHIVQGYPGGDVREYLRQYNKVAAIGRHMDYEGFLEFIRQQESIGIANDINLDENTIRNALADGNRMSVFKSGLSDLRTEKGATDADVINNKMLDAVGKLGGMNIALTDVFSNNGKPINGVFFSGTNRIIISGNAKRGVMATAAHELYHAIDAYNHEAAEKIRSIVLDSLINSGKNIDKMKQRYITDMGYSEADAETEMVCDAMWDVFDEDTCKKIVQKVGAKQTKYFVDHLADVISEMEKAFERYSVVFNEPELLDLKNDIESMKKIRDNFVKALEEMGTDSKKENTRTGDGGVKSSKRDAEEKIIDLSDDTRLKKQVEGVYGADRYKIIMSYILDELGGQPVTLSDGISAYVDKRDAMHISHKAYSRKTAEIAKVKELVEKAKYFAYEKSTKDNKFSLFRYYKAKVLFGNDIFDVYLNVGLARNDKAYHIYDITEKLRDSAHLIDVGRLTKSIAQKNAVSNGSISNPTKNVNNNFSIRLDSEYMELAKEPEKNDASLRELVEQAAKAAGYSQRMYHGSKKSADIKVFRDWQYFTENKKYAERYAGQKLYEVFVKADKWFDTRSGEDAAVFDEARQEYGLGEIGDRGLPDWTDGYDLTEYIEENGLDYDGIILDEGGDMVNGKPVYRGESYVVRKSAQVKSADPVTYDDSGNIIPLSERFKADNPDIRYSKSRELPSDVKTILDAWNQSPDRQGAYDKVEDIIKELQRGLKGVNTGAHYFNENAMRKMVGDLVKRTDTTMKRDEITARLLTITDYIAKQNDAGDSLSVLYESIVNLSNDIISQSRITAAEQLESLGDSSLTTALDNIRAMRGKSVYIHEALYKELRSGKAGFDSYADFKLRFPGIKFTVDAKKGGISWQAFIDSVTQGCESVYTQMARALNVDFDVDLAQPQVVASVLNSAKKPVNPYTAEGMSEGEAVASLTEDIINDIFKLPAWGISEKTAREIRKLRDDYEKELAETRRKERQSSKEVIRTLSERIGMEAQEVKKLQDLKTRQEKTQRKAVLRNGIIRDVKYLESRLSNPNGSKHIPEEMKGMVQDLVFAFSQKEAKTTLREVERDGQKFTVGGVTSVFNRRQLNRLQRAYEAVDKGKAGADAAGYDPDIAASIENLANTIDGKRLASLNEEQLTDIRNIVANIKGMVDGKNELFVKGRGENIENLAKTAKLNLQGKKQNTIYAGEKGKFTADMTTPIFFFESLGDPTLLRLYKNIRDGQLTYYPRVAMARDRLAEAAHKFNYGGWQGREFSIGIKGTQGTVTLTAEQALSLYATYTRSGETGKNHLLNGGMTVKTDKKTLREKAGEKKSDKKYGDANLVYNITEESAKEFIKGLPDDMKHYADALIEFMSTECAGWGNETSRKLYDYDKFTEKRYFPIVSDKSFLYTEPTTANVEKALKNNGRTKNLVEGADNPILIKDFSQTFVKHCNFMAQYSTLVLPIEDFTRVYNYEKRDIETGGYTSLKEALKVAFPGAEKYIETLLKDINGGVATNDSVNMSEKMLSAAKKQSVMASLSVAVQQPTAIMRASAYINPKYFLGNMTSGIKTIAGSLEKNAEYQEMVKYAPVAGIKAMGRFDPGMSSGAENWMLDGLMDSKFQKGKEKVDNIGGWLAERGDAVAWLNIWEACKREAAAETDLAIGSEAFLQHCGERFMDIIEHSQVYDSVFSRSQIMRKKGLGSKLVTAFGAEPTINYNMVVQAGREWKNGNKKMCVSMIGSVMISSALANAAKALVQGLRDDDEEYSYWEKFIKTFTKNLFLDPFSWIPYVSDFFDMLEGYSAKRLDLQPLQYFVDAAQAVRSDKKTTKDKVEACCTALGIIADLPLKNVWRDVDAIARNIMAFGTGKKTSKEGIKYGILEEFSNKKVLNYDLNAIRRDKMIKEGKVDALAAIYDPNDKDSTEKIIDAAKSLYMEGKIDDDRMTEILKQYKPALDDDDIYYQLQGYKFNAAKEEGDESQYSAYGEFKTAISSGKYRDATKYGDDLIKHGKDASYVRGQITNAAKDKYIELYRTDSVAAGQMRRELVELYVHFGIEGTKNMTPRQKAAQNIEKWLKED